MDDVIIDSMEITRRITVGLLVLFGLLYFFDAFLSTQFIRVDIANEANPILRYLIEATGSIVFPLYALKALMLTIAIPFLMIASRKYPTFIFILVVALNIGMVYIIHLSYGILN